MASHAEIQVAESALQPYLNDIFHWTVINDLQLNPTKSSCTLFSPHNKDQEIQLQLTISNQTIPTTKHPKILGVTFDPILTFNEHTNNIKTAASKSTNILKSLTATTWGKEKETLVATYSAITRPILEYASTVWSPIISNTSMQKLKTVQNTALRVATGCTADTNINHIHQETKVLPLKDHCNLHTSNLKQKAASSNHPLNKLMDQPKPARNMKESLFSQIKISSIHQNQTTLMTLKSIKILKVNHSVAVTNHKCTIPENKILEMQAPEIHHSEETLTRYHRRLLSQLRTNKSPFLLSYLHRINPSEHPSPLCPLCSDQTHYTIHLFQCTQIQTTLTPIDLWNNPWEAAELLDTWRRALGSAPKDEDRGVSTMADPRMGNSNNKIY